MGSACHEEPPVDDGLPSEHETGEDISFQQPDLLLSFFMDTTDSRLPYPKQPDIVASSNVSEPDRSL